MPRIFIMVTGGTNSAPVDCSAVAMYPTAGVSVTAVTGDPILYIRFPAIRGTYQVHLADSVNAFTAGVIRKSWSVKGPIGATKAEMAATPQTDDTLSKKQQELVFSAVLPRDIPGCRYGIASAVMRLEVAEAIADAGGLSECAVQAWLEY